MVTHHKFRTSRNSKYCSVMIQSDEASPGIFSGIRSSQEDTTDVWFGKDFCFIHYRVCDADFLEAAITKALPV